MSVALEQFVKSLADSGVIAPGKLENFVPPKAHPKDAQELARQLVQSKHLTKFQAQEIYQGRAKSLILGNYTILDKIGAGGMGQVFKAEHRRMERIVAIKVLPKAVMKDSAAVARFQREVKAAAKLEHPNIVTAHDADEAGGVHFLVMQCVEGSDLSALVKKDGPFPFAKAVNYTLQAARGLEFAHGEGVVHRDIKPANLLLDKKGVVKILDMGLARIDTGGDPATQAELTGTGAVMGTVDYMAPEQALSTKHVDGRADIYSLGCTLHYLVTGKATYDGDTLMAKLLAHSQKPIPSLGADAPERLQVVFEKMVAKQVEDRYQTMTEVVAALEQCQSGQSTSVSLAPSSATNPDSDVMSFLKDAPTFAPHKPRPAKPTKKPAAPIAKGPATPGNFSKKFILGAVSAGCLGLAVLAGVIFMLRTKDGTLTVEINQPDAVVEVLDEQGKVEISQPGGKGKVSISVDPGKHRLKVEKDGFKFFAQDFEMDSGGTRSIKASLQRIMGKPVDLLKLIDLKRDICFGSFRFEDGALIGDPKSVINLPYLPPADYQLTINVTRTGPPDTLAIGLTIGSQRATADIDSNEAQFSGFSLTDEHLLPEQNLVPQKQPYLTENIPATVVCTVRDSAAEIKINDKVIAKTSPASKLSIWPKYLDHHVSSLFIGSWTNFRITKIELVPLDPAVPGRANIEPSSFTVDTPAFQQWMNSVAALPAEKQVDAVTKKLQELNPGFEGKVTHKIESSVVTEFGFYTDNVTDISPVRALQRLTSLYCGGSDAGKGKLSDLSPLQGMPLTELICNRTQVSDLSPLAGMPLTLLDCSGSQVSDLSPLKGMPLKNFACGHTQVLDLASIKGMHLERCSCGSTKISDLSPLQGMPLKILDCENMQISNLSPLQGMPLTWLNVTGAKVSELAPLQGMKSLRDLNCSNSPVSDLSPLKGIPLTNLDCGSTPIATLSPLQGMPLTSLGFNNTYVTDLSPLQGMGLTSVFFSPKNITKGLEILRQSKTLKSIGIGWEANKKFPPEVFWKKYDAGEFGKPNDANP